MISNQVRLNISAQFYRKYQFQAINCFDLSNAPNIRAQQTPYSGTEKKKYF